MSQNSEETLVSVVIAVYNVEDYLGECLDSIVNQTYNNLEIILVDDGSTDQSGIICDKYSEQDSRVQVIHKENGGASAARNKGFEIAKGKYIYFCDSDDYIDCHCIEKLISVIETEKTDFVIFNALAFGDCISERQKYSYVRKFNYAKSKGHELLLLQLRFDEFKPGACLALFDANFLRGNQMKFECGIMGEDELFSFLAYIKADYVSYCKDTMYYRRVRLGSVMTSTSFFQRFNNYYHMYRIMLEELSKAPEGKVLVIKEFIIRIAKSTLLAWKNLNEAEKQTGAICHDQLVKDIRLHDGFGDISLLIRLRWWYCGVLISGIRKAYYRRRTIKSLDKQRR